MVRCKTSSVIPIVPTETWISSRLSATHAVGAAKGDQVCSIGWISWHIGWWWSMVQDHSFGSATMRREVSFGASAVDVSQSWLVGLAGVKSEPDQRVTERRMVDGKELRAAAVNEHQARAAAGITMAVGAVAFAYANFDKVFWPIRTVSAFFFIDFAVRVTAGLERSPTGLVAAWMTRRQPAQWVSARPKRFAWTLGLAMALAMAIITNSGIHGPLPRTICLICLTLMWMEAVLGLCLGCEIYGLMVRRGWRTRDDAFEICANGACVAGRTSRPIEPVQ